MRNMTVDSTYFQIIINPVMELPMNSPAYGGFTIWRELVIMP